MSRLIDAEICRRRISDERTDDKRWNEALNRACRIVCEQPTVDAVSVVRCKDCKFFREHLSMNCVYHISAVGENWFCSQGRVKE